MSIHLIRLLLLAAFLCAAIVSPSLAQAPSASPIIVQAQSQPKDFFDYALAVIQLITLIALIVYVIKTVEIASATKQSTAVSQASLDAFKESEKRRVKLDTLRRFVANRFHVTSVEFLKVLNEIFMIFHDSEEAKQAVSDYYKNLGQPNENDYLLMLFKAMCKDLNISLNKDAETFFLKPFSARGGAI